MVPCYTNPLVQGRRPIRLLEKVWIARSYLCSNSISLLRSQRKMGSSYVYTVEVNGAVVKSVINLQPKEFSNVKIYGGDPWYQAAQGVMRNLVVESGKRTVFMRTMFSKWNNEKIDFDLTGCPTKYELTFCILNYFFDYFLLFSIAKSFFLLSVLHHQPNFPLTPENHLSVIQDFSQVKSVFGAQFWA